jgi:hypothetical protein
MTSTTRAIAALIEIMSDDAVEILTITVSVLLIVAIAFVF